MRICLGANTHEFPRAAGHVWVYLNWALALRDLGHQVVWLELIEDDAPPEQLAAKVETLREALAPFGLADSLAIGGAAGAPLPSPLAAPLNRISSVAPGTSTS